MLSWEYSVSVKVISLSGMFWVVFKIYPWKTFDTGWEVIINIRILAKMSSFFLSSSFTTKGDNLQEGSWQRGSYMLSETSQSAHPTTFNSTWKAIRNLLITVTFLKKLKMGIKLWIIEHDIWNPY